MRTFNIHEAKTHLSRLIERGRAVRDRQSRKAAGEGCRVRRAGVNAGPPAGFIAGQVAVPEDFDRMGGAEIEELFTTDR
jgi:hypothetical protein